MSLEYHAFLPAAAIPSRQAWQEAAVALGFPVQIDPALVPREAGGFCPATIAGHDSGFEIELEDAASLIDSYPLLEGRVGAADSVLTFRLDGDEAEGACVFALAATLVGSFGAVLFDPQDDTLLNRPEHLVEQARTLLASLRAP